MDSSSSDNSNPGGVDFGRKQADLEVERCDRSATAAVTTAVGGGGAVRKDENDDFVPTVGLGGVDFSRNGDDLEVERSGEGATAVVAATVGGGGAVKQVEEDDVVVTRSGGEGRMLGCNGRGGRGGRRPMTRGRSTAANEVVDVMVTPAALIDLHA